MHASLMVNMRYNHYNPVTLCARSLLCEWANDRCQGDCAGTLPEQLTASLRNGSDCSCDKGSQEGERASRDAMRMVTAVVCNLPGLWQLQGE